MKELYGEDYTARGGEYHYYELSEKFYLTIIVDEIYGSDPNDGTIRSINYNTPLNTTKPTNSSVGGESTVKTGEILTDADAAAILSDLIPQGLSIYGKFNGVGFETDSSQTIPGDGSYSLIADDSVKTMADLRNSIESVFTKDSAEQIFYSRYLDVSEEPGLPLYKDYNGRLYGNTDNGGHGFMEEWFPDRSHIIYQDDYFAEILVPVAVYDDSGNRIVIIKNAGEKWLIAAPLLY
jgi:hypothetical protein